MPLVALSIVAEPVRETALVDLISIDAQIALPTQDLINLLLWVRDYPSECDSFSVSTFRGRLLVRLFAYGEAKALKARREVDCIGRLPRRFAAYRRDLVELCGADFYDRMTTVSVSDQGESLYIGKYWLPLYAPNALSGTPPQSELKAPTAEEQLIQRIRALDAEHIAAPPASAFQLAQRYERDEILVRLLKRLRGPNCQICGTTFRTRSGEFYSECHHLEGLANDGLDVSNNILVLCSTHHAHFHHGEVSIKLHTADQVTVEIDGVAYTCAVGPRRSAHADEIVDNAHD